MSASSEQAKMAESEQQDKIAKACLQTHPSTLEAARAFIDAHPDALPGGTAGLTLPSLPKPSLTFPPSLTMPPPPRPQQQSSSVARPIVAGPVIASAGPARSTFTSPWAAAAAATPVTSATSPAATISTATSSTATSSTVDTNSPGVPIGGSSNSGLAGPASGVLPTISNIVSSVNLDCRLDLKVIALNSRNSEYNPRRFSAVIMRIRDPKSTALIFASGKMVVTGSKSEADSRLAARKFARVLAKLGYAVKFSDFKIHNVVANCDVGFPIALQRMITRHSRFSSYDPGMVSSIL